jgi:hypothetical protein
VREDICARTRASRDKTDFEEGSTPGECQAETYGRKVWIANSVSVFDQLVAGAVEGTNRRRQLYPIEQDVISVERGDRKDGNAGIRKGLQKRREHACHCKWKWPVKFQRDPIALHADTNWNPAFLANDGKFVRGLGYAKKSGADRPFGYLRSGRELANSQGLAEHAIF